MFKSFHLLWYGTKLYYSVKETSSSGRHLSQLTIMPHSQWGSTPSRTSPHHEYTNYENDLLYVKCTSLISGLLSWPNKGSQRFLKSSCNKNYILANFWTIAIVAQCWRPIYIYQDEKQVVLNLWFLQNTDNRKLIWG